MAPSSLFLLLLNVFLQRSRYSVLPGLREAQTYRDGKGPLEVSSPKPQLEIFLRVVQGVSRWVQMSFVYLQEWRSHNLWAAYSMKPSPLQRYISEDCTLPAVLLCTVIYFNIFALKPALSPWTIGEVRFWLYCACAHPKKWTMCALCGSSVLKAVFKF